MVVGALGIDPELEQASRTVERTRYTAFPFQFPDVSQVDENHLVRAQPADRFLGGNDSEPSLPIASSAEMICIRASAASTSSL
jgi:hypothetical protein